MLRLGVTFEQLFAADRQRLEVHLFRLRREGLWARLLHAAGASSSKSPPTGQPERRGERRLHLADKGDLLALVEEVDRGDGPRPALPGEGMDDAAAGDFDQTGRVRTYNIIDISPAGCALLVSEGEAFAEGVVLHLKIVGEDFALDVQARVTNTTRVDEDEDL